jgi:hypothetical protein
LLELAGEAGRRDDIAGAPDAGAAALAMRDQHRVAQPRSDRRGGVADMDHYRGAVLARPVTGVYRLAAQLRQKMLNQLVMASSV